MDGKSCVVRGITNGEVSLKATTKDMFGNEQSGEIQLTVTGASGADVAVESIELVGSDDLSGETQYTVDFTPVESTISRVEFGVKQTDDDGHACIIETGENACTILPMVKGTVTLEATAYDRSGNSVKTSKTLNVTGGEDAPVDIQTISLTGELELSGAQTYTVELTPSNGTYTRVEWSYEKTGEVFGAIGISQTTGLSAYIDPIINGTVTIKARVYKADGVSFVEANLPVTVTGGVNGVKLTDIRFSTSSASKDVTIYPVPSNASWSIKEYKIRSRYEGSIRGTDQIVAYTNGLIINENTYKFNKYCLFYYTDFYVEITAIDALGNTITKEQDLEGGYLVGTGSKGKISVSIDKSSLILNEEKTYKCTITNTDADPTLRHDAFKWVWSYTSDDGAIVNITTKVDKSAIVTPIKNGTVNLKFELFSATGALINSDVATIEVTGGYIQPETPKVEQSDVNFIDYDGELVYSYTKAEFLQLENMPDNPTHDGLVAQGWNYTFEDATDYVTKYGKLVIGQNYTTDDGHTRFKVYVKPNKEIAIRFTCASGTGSVNIDWGDGNGTYTSEISSGNKYTVTETYESGGEKNISMWFTGDVDIELGGGDSYSAAIGLSESGKIYTGSILEELYIGNNISSITGYAFYRCVFMTKVSIPNYIKKIVASGFYECTNIIGIVIPSGVKEITGNVIGSCTALKYISLPKSAVDINNYAFSGTTGIRMLTLPDGVQTLQGNIFNSRIYCIIVLPSTITTLAASSFNSQATIKELYVFSENPPSGLNYISRMSPLKIYTKNEYVDTYKSSLPDLADYIYSID